MKDTKKPGAQSTPAMVDPRALAGLISAVMLHPELPGKLHDFLGEGLCELFNGLGAKQKDAIENTPERIADLLAATAENEKGDAR
jgi:hypothetical protein